MPTDAFSKKSARSRSRAWRASSARLRATAHAAEKKDPAAIPHLIEQLGSDDPLVRMASIRTLEEITGQTLGYHHWAPEQERQKAIQAWVDWYNRERPGPSGPALRSAAAPPPDTTGGSSAAPTPTPTPPTP